MKSPPKFAAIDIGSNMFHLNIYEQCENGRLSLTESFKESVQLANGVDHLGNLEEKSITKALKNLKVMAEIVALHKASYKAVATHAVRKAKNFEYFLNRVQEETGLSVDIIDGAEEAHLCYLGTTLDHYGNDTNLYVDIGGGSTEIGMTREGEFSLVSSLNLGTVNITKNFISEPLDDSLKHLKSYLVSRFFPIAIDVAKQNFNNYIFTAGTAKALARVIYKYKNGKKLLNPGGYEITPSDIDEIVQEISRKYSPERLQLTYDLEKSRSELILAGATIIQVMMDLLLIPKLKVSKFGLREGLALSFYRKNDYKVQASETEIRKRSIKDFGLKFGVEEADGLFRQKQAISIFDAINKLIHPDETEETSNYKRELLGSAAYLMNVGKYLSFSSHHKHTYYIISNSQILGFSHHDRHLMALIARYSRKKTAKPESKSKKPYLLDNLATINTLGGYLRLTRIILQAFKESEIISIEASSSNECLKLTCKTTNSENFGTAEVLTKKAQNYIETSLGRPIVYEFQLG